MLAMNQTPIQVADFLDGVALSLIEANRTYEPKAEQLHKVSQHVRLNKHISLDLIKQTKAELRKLNRTPEQTRALNILTTLTGC